MLGHEGQCQVVLPFGWASLGSEARVCPSFQGGPRVCHFPMQLGKRLGAAVDAPLKQGTKDWVICRICREHCQSERCFCLSLCPISRRDPIFSRWLKASSVGRCDGPRCGCRGENRTWCTGYILKQVP